MNTQDIVNDLRRTLPRLGISLFPDYSIITLTFRSDYTIRILKLNKDTRVASDILEFDVFDIKSNFEKLFNIPVLRIEYSTRVGHIKIVSENISVFYYYKKDACYLFNNDSKNYRPINIYDHFIKDIYKIFLNPEMV